MQLIIIASLAGVVCTYLIFFRRRLHDHRLETALQYFDTRVPSMTSAPLRGLLQEKVGVIQDIDQVIGTYNDEVRRGAPKIPDDVTATDTLAQIVAKINTGLYVDRDALITIVAEDVALAVHDRASEIVVQAGEHFHSWALEHQHQLLETATRGLKLVFDFSPNNFWDFLTAGHRLADAGLHHVTQAAATEGLHHAAAAGASDVLGHIVVHGVDVAQTIGQAKADALAAGHDAAGGAAHLAGIPIFTILRSGWRETKLLSNGKTDVGTAGKNFLADVGSTATGMLVGAKVGAAAGTAFFPGFGTLIGAVGGAAGALLARLASDQFKYKPLRQKVEEHQDEYARLEVEERRSLSAIQKRQRELAAHLRSSYETDLGTYPAASRSEQIVAIADELRSLSTSDCQQLTDCLNTLASESLTRMPDRWYHTAAGMSIGNELRVTIDRRRKQLLHEYRIAGAFDEVQRRPPIESMLILSNADWLEGGELETRAQSVIQGVEPALRDHVEYALQWKTKAAAHQLAAFQRIGDSFTTQESIHSQMINQRIAKLETIREQIVREREKLGLD